MFKLGTLKVRTEYPGLFCMKVPRSLSAFYSCLEDYKKGVCLLRHECIGTLGECLHPIVRLADIGSAIKSLHETTEGVCYRYNI